MPCRRCSECRGCDHHWMPESTGMIPCPHFVCKHCDAVGQECPDCGGYGHGREIANGPHVDECESKCSVCDGIGIVTASWFRCSSDSSMVEGDSRALQTVSQLIVATDLKHAERLFCQMESIRADGTILIVPVTPVGFCEDCETPIVEGDPYLTDPDGDGKFCSVCAARYGEPVTPPGVTAS